MASAARAGCRTLCARFGGLSSREYHAAAEAIPEAFGLAKSSVSRRFVHASAHALQQLQERRLDDREWLVLLLDGKSFASDQLVVALGVTTTGEKRILGLVQTATENKAVCATLLRDLEARGFVAPHGLLVVRDGAKGLRAAVRDVYGPDVAVQRCQWHKRENVVGYLRKPQQILWRRKLQAAYAHPAHADAKRALQRLHQELVVLNASAANSLAEGLDETLTLHGLGVVAALGVSFKTTNLIENVMSQLERKTQRVARWRTSDQKLRWCAAALLQLEPRLRRIKGCEQLPLLQAALRNKLHLAKRAAA
jgi:transposase-like protein